MICFNSFWDLGSLEDVILRLLSAYLEARPARILRNFVNGKYIYSTYLYTTTQTYMKTRIKILKKLSKAIQNF